MRDQKSAVNFLPRRNYAAVLLKRHTEISMLSKKQPADKIIIRILFKKVLIYTEHLGCSEKIKKFVIQLSIYSLFFQEINALLSPQPKAAEVYNSLFYTKKYLRNFTEFNLLVLPFY